MADPPKKRQRRMRPGTQFFQSRGVQVSESRIRELFILARIQERHRNGELTRVVVRQNPANPMYGQVEGTMSLSIEYRDSSGKTVAEVHLFVKPDGTFGASKLEDPKVVVHSDVRYYYDRSVERGALRST